MLPLLLLLQTSLQNLSYLGMPCRLFIARHGPPWEREGDVICDCVLVFVKINGCIFVGLGWMVCCLEARLVPCVLTGTRGGVFLGVWGKLGFVVVVLKTGGASFLVGQLNAGNDPEQSQYIGGQRPRAQLTVHHWSNTALPCQRWTP